MRDMTLNPGREFQPEDTMSTRRREREGVKSIEDISKANTVVGSSQPVVGEGPIFCQRSTWIYSPQNLIYLMDS